MSSPNTFSSLQSISHFLIPSAHLPVLIRYPLYLLYCAFAKIQVEVCRSQHTQTWLGVLYAYKGLLLVVGVYMAYETRHVKIAQLNDSQYIGLSVYSVVITSSIVVVLANLIAERVTLAFITITALIITSTTSTLCLLFVPKMHDIWGKGRYNTHYYPFCVNSILIARGRFYQRTS